MGRHKKEPTYTRGLRICKDLKEFLESLENGNDFIVAQIKSSSEYQKFLEQKQEQDLAKYPSLPFDE